MNASTKTRASALLLAAAIMTAGAGIALAEEKRAPAASAAPAVSLIKARSLGATQVTATGRVVATASARVSPRVSGHLVAIGKDASGKILDAGMSVKKGDLLFELDDTTFKNAHAMASAAMASAQASLENLKAPTRPERVEQFKQAIKELEARLQEKKRDEERYVRLVETEKTVAAKRLEEARTEVIATTATLASARARLAEAETGATRTELAIAEARVKEAQVAVKVAEDDLRDTKIRAPFDGVITRRSKGIGDYIASNPPVEVMDIVALDSLEIEFRLPESYLAEISDGKTRVKVRSRLLKADTELPVTRVISDVDPARGTFAFRVAVPAEQRGGLVAGAFVTGDVALESTNDQALVPARAIVASGGQSHVFTESAGVMRRRDVQVIERLTEEVVIRGVKPGESVLVGPSESLKEGQPVTAVK